MSAFPHSFPPLLSSCFGDWGELPGVAVPAPSSSTGMPFTDCHERFGLEQVDVHCKCGQKWSRLHPFSCPHARAHKAKLLSLTDKRIFTPNEILRTVQGTKIFAGWAPKNRVIKEKQGTRLIGEAIGDVARRKGFLIILQSYSKRITL